MVSRSINDKQYVQIEGRETVVFDIDTPIIYNNPKDEAMVRKMSNRRFSPVNKVPKTISLSNFEINNYEKHKKSSSGFHDLASFIKLKR